MPGFNRIAIIGTTGSGKTTLAKQLSQYLNIQHIELDALHFTSQWQEVPDDLFRQRVQHATNQNQWITDGNYSILRDIIWQKADCIIWLNYSFTINFSRLVKRTLGRVIGRQELWHGNKESLKTTLSKDSIILWFFKTYRRNRTNYPQLFAHERHKHLQVLTITHPKNALQQAIHFIQNKR